MEQGRKGGQQINTIMEKNPHNGMTLCGQQLTKYGGPLARLLHFIAEAKRAYSTTTDHLARNRPLNGSKGGRVKDLGMVMEF